MGRTPAAVSPRCARRAAGTPSGWPSCGHRTGADSPLCGNHLASPRAAEASPRPQPSYLLSATRLSKASPPTISLSGFRQIWTMWKVAVWPQVLSFRALLRNLKASLGCPMCLPGVKGMPGAGEGALRDHGSKLPCWMPSLRALAPEGGSVSPLLSSTQGSLPLFLCPLPAPSTEPNSPAVDALAVVKPWLQRHPARHLLGQFKESRSLFKLAAPSEQIDQLIQHQKIV